MVNSFFLCVFMATLGCGNGAVQQEHQVNEANSQDKGFKTFSEVYDNGQVKIKGTLVDGKRHGLWVSYFKNGLKWSEENYYMGAKDGKAVSYYPNGMLRFRGTYVDDERAGMWTFYDEEGRIEKEVDFNEK